MSSRSTWKLVVVLLALSLVAVACNGDGDAEGKDTIEVVWIRGTDHPEGMALLQVLDAFTASTGINYTYQGLGDDLPTVLATRVEGGDPPDVAILAQPGILRDLVALDAAIPVSETVQASLDADFAPVWTELATVDGTTYGVYFKAGNKSFLFYHPGTFEELGITPPTTWDEWIAVSQTLVDNGVPAISVGGADGWTLSDWFENVFAQTAGAEKYAQLTAHEIPWTDPSVEAAFNEMEKLIGQEDFLAGGSAGALQNGFVDAIVLAFGDPSGAATMYGPGAVAGIAGEEAGATVGTDLAAVAFPSIGGAPPTVLGGGDVAVAMTDDPSSMALLEFLATPEAANVWAPLGGFTSPNKRTDLSLYPDEIGQAAAEGLVNAQVFVFDLSDLIGGAFGSTTGQGIWGNLQKWLENPDDLATVLDALEAEATAQQG